VRSLGDETLDIADNSNVSDVSDDVKTELNESLLEDGVSLETEETSFDKDEQERLVEEKSPKQSGPD